LTSPPLLLLLRQRLQCPLLLSPSGSGLVRHLLRLLSSADGEKSMGKKWIAEEEDPSEAPASKRAREEGTDR
jgi:hypothetical protein